MRAQISSFCREYDYPPQVQQALLCAYDCICGDGESLRLLEENAALLWQGAFTCLGEDLCRLDEIARRCGLHPYTVHLLFYVLCAPTVRQRYAQRGLPMDIYRQSMLALKWKMQKTYPLYGVWGSAWAAWFRPFFELKRFGIGRLEFELAPSMVDFTGNGHVLQKGEPVVNVHIPAAGALEHGAVLASYGRAASFFREAFPGKWIPFQCCTWMLYPPVAALVPGGNIWRFAQDYEIAATEDAPEEDDRWRIFPVPEGTPVAAYPENTGLQKKLKSYIMEGKSMGCGVGVLFYPLEGEGTL